MTKIHINLLHLKDTVYRQNRNNFLVSGSVMLLFLLSIGISGLLNSSLTITESKSVEKEETEVFKENKSDDVIYIFGDGNYDLSGTVPGQISFFQSQSLASAPIKNVVTERIASQRLYLLYCNLKLDAVLI